MSNAELASCRSTPSSSEMSDAGLRGLGGAGFPAGRKWQIVRSYPGPRLMTINGDEGEPGTFKDRYYLERNPQQMFEGALIAAWAVEAERIYLYMRDEYPVVLHILAHEIAALEKAGIIDKGFIELRRGAGAYICGEELAMIESSKASAAIRAIVRPISLRSACSGGRPSITMSRRSIGCRRSSRRARNGSPITA